MKKWSNLPLRCNKTFLIRFLPISKMMTAKANNLHFKTNQSALFSTTVSEIFICQCLQILFKCWCTPPCKTWSSKYRQKIKYDLTYPIQLPCRIRCGQAEVVSPEGGGDLVVCEIVDNLQNRICRKYFRPGSTVWVAKLDSGTFTKKN